MNRIEIIKRDSLQSRLKGLETEIKKINPALAKRRAARVVGSRIEEWREKKPRDARHAFADLFRRSSTAV